MTPERKNAFTKRWAGAREALFQGDDVEPPSRGRRADPDALQRRREILGRPRDFGHRPIGRPEQDYQNQRRGMPNLILDDPKFLHSIRVTKVGKWHWVKTGDACVWPRKRFGPIRLIEFGYWVGFGERWNRFSKTWSEPQLFYCEEFECEGNTTSQL